MTPTRWKKVRSILDEALDHEDPSQQAHFLDRACANDAALRNEVESLLAAYQDGNDTFFEQRPQPSSPPSLDEHVGPYRLLRPLDHGGMGVVYLAERADDQFQRQVAIKVLKHGLDFKEDFTRRFLSERQILASLQHANIAQLYDGGVTKDGRPYLVMEYVEGVPIDTYCAEQACSIEERLRLFARVTEVVQYAHQNLVVHRDLKPSNILVTKDGEPKLLDFGIAKLLEERAPADPVTQTGQLLMTPEYAAPEQLRGETVTTATDIYQLGVLLYELLAGRRPYRAAERTPSQLQRAILEQEPERPSSIADEEVRQRLQGDLDTVVLKALRKEPERRYASAEALMDDVRRHLEGLPVMARPATWRYRTQKFVRRHQWGVSTAAAFLVLLISFATLYTYRVAEERDRAQTEAAKAKQVSTFLTDLFANLDPEHGEGPEMSVRDLLDNGATRAQRELQNQPAVQANLLNVIGSAYRGIGHYDESLRLQRRALNLTTEHFGPNSAQAADAQNNLGEVLYYLGRYDEAEMYYRRSLRTRRQLYGDMHVDIAQILNNLGLIDDHRADYAQAEERFQKAIAIFKSELGPRHWRIANAQENLAAVLIDRGQLAKADSLYQASLTMLQSLEGRARHDVALAVVRNGYGRLLRTQGQPKAAAREHRQALANLRRLLAERNPFIGDALYQLGRALHDQDRLEEAEQHYQEALTLLRRTLSEHDPRLANPMVALGLLRMEENRLAEADSLLRHAVRIRREALPAGHWKTAEARRALATSLLAQQHYEEAELTLHTALRMLSPAPYAAPHRQALREQLAAVYEAWDKPDQAKHIRSQSGVAPGG